LNDAEMAERKTALVAEAVKAFPQLEGAEISACRPAPSRTGYRTRVKLAVGETRGSGPLVIGLFQPGTHDVLDIPHCLVVHPGLRPVIDALRTLGCGCELAFVDLRWSLLEKACHVSLVTRGDNPAGIPDLARRLMQKHPEVVGVGLRRTSGPVPRTLSGRTEPVAGVESLAESLAGKRFRLSPGAFFQVSPVAAEWLHQEVRSWLLPGGQRGTSLLDLYAGVGAFAVSLADGFSRVTAVESVEDAAEDARASAAGSSASVHVVTAAAEDLAETIPGIAADCVVVDPPRRGAGVRVLSALGASPALRRAAYVACDPETAARDAYYLGGFGFRLSRVDSIDMFANTDQVESIFKIEKGSSGPAPDITECAAGVFAVFKPPLVPLAAGLGGSASLLQAAAAAAEVNGLAPVYDLPADASGPVLLASGQLPALKGQLAKGTLVRKFTVLVRGVPHKKGHIRLKGGRRASPPTCSYRLDRVVGGYGLVQIEILGDYPDTPQRFLAHIRHPVLGDEETGDRRANRFMAETCALARPFVHLSSLRIPAADGRHIALESPLPPDLLLVLRRLDQIREGSDRTAAARYGLGP
jgi:23S rRNA (uracil1939-C5)-methyltransferase